MLREDTDTWRPILHPPDGLPETVRERIAADRERVREMFASLISDIGKTRDDREYGMGVEIGVDLPVRPHSGRVLVDEPDLSTTERLMDGAKAGLGTFWRQ